MTGSHVRVGGALASVPDPSPEAFVAHCLTAKQGARLPAKSLQDAYANWCTAHGLKPLGAAKLAQGLEALGIRKTRGGRNWSYVYHDVVLRLGGEA